MVGALCDLGIRILDSTTARVVVHPGFFFKFRKKGTGSYYLGIWWDSLRPPLCKSPSYILYLISYILYLISYILYLISYILYLYLYLYLYPYLYVSIAISIYIHIYISFYNQYIYINLDTYIYIMICIYNLASSISQKKVFNPTIFEQKNKLSISI